MVRKKGKGRAVKRARQKFGAHYESEDLKLAPHSMVIHRGDVDKDIKILVEDVRKVMEPFTASDLKATRKNSLKDFVSIAGPLHVTHLMVFSQTDLVDHLKLIRLPRGPTLNFKIIEYSLRNDVLSVLKKKQTHQKQYLHQPLLILNGFNQTNNTEPELHLKLLTATLQNMFPSINVTKVKLNEIKRCVIFNYNKEDNTIDFRQYNINLNPVGLSKPVKKLNQEKIPDLSNYQDISEYIEKLSEIGPRMKLKLLKIEEGLCEGQVLYHDVMKNLSEEELAKLRQDLKAKKQEKKESKKAVGKKKFKQKRSSHNDSLDDEDQEYNDKISDSNTMNKLEEDIDYYREELGDEPSADFFKKQKPLKRKRNDENDIRHLEESVDLKRKKLVKFADGDELMEGGGQNKPKVKAKFLGFSKKKKDLLFNKNK